MSWGGVLTALLTNFCVLVTLTFFGSLTYTDGDSALRRRLPPWALRLLRYLLAAGGGVLLLAFAVQVPGGVLLDLRKVPVALAGLFTGPWVAALVALPAALYRLWIGGPGAPLAVVSVLAQAALSGWLWRRLPRGGPLDGRAWWLYALTFAATNLSLLLVPHIIVTQQLMHLAVLTVAQTLGLMASLAVLNVRFRATARLSSYRDQAYHDPLTGLYNRRQFDEDLARLSAQERAHLIILDVDHFKGINDTHGHGFGDEVLRLLGSLLTLNVGEHGRAYRLGGEEFGVLLRHTDGLGAARLADHLRELAARQLSALFGVAGFQITLSAGGAAFEGNPTRMLTLADSRLYDAKRGGRNRTVFDRMDGPEPAPQLSD